MSLATIFGGLHAGFAAEADASSRLADAVALRFGDAMRQKQFSFLAEARIEARQAELRAFVGRYAPSSPDDDFTASLLTGIDQCVDRLYRWPASIPLSRREETMWYRWDPDIFRTFEWHLWIALVRPPLTEEQQRRLAAQHQWMAVHIATESIHRNVSSRGMSEAEVRPWIGRQLALDRANPLSLLHDPLEPDAFAAVQKRAAEVINGVTSDYHDFHVQALAARFPVRTDTTARYGHSYSGELPCDDVVVDLWGNGPWLAFASNADFRGQWLSVRGTRALDAARCTEIDLLPGGSNNPQGARVAPTYTRADIKRWSNDAGHGDVWFELPAKIMHALRGATIARLPVADWFAADELSDAQLTEVLERDGRLALYFDSLPPMNGFKRLDGGNGEFFIVVRTSEQRLAVVELTACEFGSVDLSCRTRPVRPPI